VFEREVFRKSDWMTLTDRNNGLPKTSANNDQHRSRNIPEEQRPQQIKQDEM